MPIVTRYGIADFYCNFQGFFISLLCSSCLCTVCTCHVPSSLKAEMQLSEVASNETLNPGVHGKLCVKRSTN